MSFLIKSILSIYFLSKFEFGALNVRGYKWSRIQGSNNCAQSFTAHVALNLVSRVTKLQDQLVRNIFRKTKINNE